MHIPVRVHPSNKQCYWKTSQNETKSEHEQEWWIERLTSPDPVLTLVGSCRTSPHTYTDTLIVPILVTFKNKAAKFSQYAYKSPSKNKIFFVCITPMMIEYFILFYLLVINVQISNKTGKEISFWIKIVANNLI